MTLTSSDERALGNLLADAEAALIAGDAALLKVLRDGLPRLISSDLALTTRFDRRAGTTTTETSEPAFVAFRTRHLEYWGACLEMHPSVAYWEEGGSERVIRFSDLISQRAYERLALYGDFFRPFGVRYKLDARLWLAGGSTIDVGFARASRDFTEDDCDLLRALQPHLQALALRATDPRSPSRALQARFDLTLREAEVLAQLARGRTSLQVANTLFVSSATVRKHLERIFRKLGVRNRTDAVRQTLALVTDASEVAATLTPSGRNAPRHDHALTPRESEVLQQIRLGKSNAQAAETLGVSTSTIRRHLEHIYSKTGAHNRTEAAFAQPISLTTDSSS